MQKNQVKLRNHSVDLVKCIAALLVVSVHADAFSEMSPVLEISLTVHLEGWQCHSLHASRVII